MKNKAVGLMVDDYTTKIIFEDNFLKQIQINLRKYKELVLNGLVDEESILDVEEVHLILTNQKVVTVPVLSGRAYYQDLIGVNSVNQKGYFTFFADPSNPIHSNIGRSGGIKKR